MATCGDYGGRCADGSPCSRSVSGESRCYQHCEGSVSGGRPPHEPDPRSRAFVESSTMAGLPQSEVASVLGVGTKTLRKHYREELDHGKTKANAKVMQTLFQMATSGKQPAMTKFWCQTQLGMSTTQSIRHEGADGGPVSLQWASLDDEGDAQD